MDRLDDGTVELCFTERGDEAEEDAERKELLSLLASAQLGAVVCCQN